MKAYIFLVFCYLSCCGSLLNGQGDEKNSDEKAILEIMAEQEACWNKADLDCFMEGYWKSDSLRYIGSSGVNYGWQNTLDRYKKSYSSPEKMGTLTFDIVSLEFLCEDNAMMLGKWHLKRTEDELQGYFTLIWTKFEEGWRIVYDHSS